MGLFRGRIILLIILLAVSCGAATPPTYQAYRSGFPTRVSTTGQVELVLDATSIIAEGAGEMILQQGLENQTGSSLRFRGPGHWVEWEIDVPREAFYSLSFEYLPAMYDPASMMALAIEINGESPFQELTALQIPRGWQPDERAAEREPDRSQTSGPMPQSRWIRWQAEDLSLRQSDPYLLWLRPGTHRIRVYHLSGEFDLGSVRLTSFTNLPTYARMQQEWAGLPQNASGVEIRIEGERYLSQYVHSDAVIFMDVEADPKRRFNALGSWHRPGNWVEWEFTVPASGLYRISFRYSLGPNPMQEGALASSQTHWAMTISDRALRINGQYPFAEATALTFTAPDRQPRESNYWSWATPLYRPRDPLTGQLGAPVPYTFYLTEGTHTLQMAPTLVRRTPLLGELRRVQAQMEELLAAMQAVMGPNPLPGRWYRLDERWKETLVGWVGELTLLRLRIDQFHPGSTISREVSRLADQLVILANNPQFDSGGYVGWTQSVRRYEQWVNRFELQPMNIDAIVITSLDRPLPSRNDSLWGRISNFLRYRFDW